MESSRQIEERALAWLARRDGGLWASADDAELSAWLDADTANRVAFLRLEAGWERTARLKALGAGAEPGRVPLRGAWGVSKLRGRTLSWPAVPKLAAAAAAVALLVGGAFFWEASRNGQGYETPVGGVSSIPLSDGSRIELNTASRIRVAISKQERRIELEAGEAFFDVARDASRPFVVVAGDQRVVAVGTQFSVWRNGKDLRVVVTEGRVRIEGGEGESRGGLLEAGAVASAVADAVVVKQGSTNDADEALSWRRGYLTFEETPLGDALAEFNRYSDRHIRIEDPRLASVRISGKFRSNNAGDFIHLLDTGFGIRARQADGEIRLTHD